MRECPFCGRVFDELGYHVFFAGHIFDTVRCADAWAVRRKGAGGILLADGTTPAVDVVAAQTDEASETVALRRRLVRIASDIHDGPLQSIAALGDILRELQRRLNDRFVYRQAVDEGLRNVIAELATVEGRLRTLIGPLGHVRPELETIEEIVEAEVATLHARSDAKVTVDLAADAEPATASQAIAIRAVLREALANVAQHAEASEVDIRVEAGSRGFLLEIVDDGVGFDTASVREGALGLRSMRQRVELLGGHFSVRTQPGGPTLISAQLPHWTPAA